MSVTSYTRSYNSKTLEITRFSQQNSSAERFWSVALTPSDHRDALNTPLGRSGLSPEHEITPPEAAQAKFGRFTM